MYLNQERPWRGSRGVRTGSGRCACDARCHRRHTLQGKAFPGPRRENSNGPSSPPASTAVSDTPSSRRDSVNVRPTSSLRACRPSSPTATTCWPSTAMEVIELRLSSAMRCHDAPSGVPRNKVPRWPPPTVRHRATRRPSRACRRSRCPGIARSAPVVGAQQLPAFGRGIERLLTTIDEQAHQVEVRAACACRRRQIALGQVAPPSSVVSTSDHSPTATPRRLSKK